jgi:hypothetical protein
VTAQPDDRGHGADPLVEFVRRQHEAFEHLPRGGSAEWPRQVADPFPEVRDRVPEIDAEHLGSDLIAGALQHHGSVLVRGLLDAATASALVRDIDRAFAARDASESDPAAGHTAPWYEPFVPAPAYRLLTPRETIRDASAMWAADSPAALADAFRALIDVGFPAMVSDYFGEEAVLSVNKCALRRVPARPRLSGWHQDGSFLGDGVRALNAWIALSECGDGAPAPGIDIVPRRIGAVLPTNGPGHRYPILVSKENVQRALGDAPIADPRFEPGDALLFDELLLHRTAGVPESDTCRYALETWFFAASAFPPVYAPIVVPRDPGAVPPVA